MAGSGFLKGSLGVTATITAGDLEIGAVELKNATTDDRAKVAATASVAEGDIAVAVQAPVLGTTAGAAVITDAAGTVQQYLRGLVKLGITKEADLGPDATESALAIGAFAPGAAILSLVSGGVYYLELWPDPNAAGGALSDVVWGRWKLGAAPGSDTGGIPIVTGMTRRICPASNVDLYVRKHSKTDYACRFVVWRKDA